MGIGTLRRYHKFRAEDGVLKPGLTAPDLGTDPTGIEDVNGEPTPVLESRPVELIESEKTDVPKVRESRSRRR